MKLHVKSQIVMYVNGRPSLHINLHNVFIYCTKQLNHHLYIPFIVMYKRIIVYGHYITYEGTDIIMCVYINVLIICMYYYITIYYGGSHASDVLHVLMGVSVT